MYLVTGFPLEPEASSDGRNTIRWRRDDNDAIEDNASESTSHDSFFFGGAGVVGELLETKKFRVQFTPFNSPPGVATFDLSGIASAIQPLRKGCPKDLPQTIEK
jgi:hypothetical protein